MHPIVVAALYKFVRLEDYKSLRAPLLDLCQKNGIKGILLLAREGLNGTVAGSRVAIDSLKAYLNQDPRFQEGVEYKESFADEMPFYRMKVRLKKEIVTIGLDDVDPTRTVGTYLTPDEWNRVISDPEVVLIDTRNDYEVDIGTFKGAINPKTRTFREFPEYVQKHFDPKKNKKVAMFCTGGIRCEKASAYMKQAGFEEVYHLKGGILKYLEEMPKEKSLWEGECFVFDQRIAVGHALELSDYTMCYGCRYPLSPEDRSSKKYLEGVHCPHCYDSLTEEKKQRTLARQRQVELAKKRGLTHIGNPS